MVRQNHAGIDVSKRWFDAEVLLKEGSVQARFAQNPEGFAQHDAWLMDHGVVRLWVTLEYTGGYERPLAEHLLAQGHRVSLVTGIKIKRFKESHGIKSKTDRVDAKAIALYCKERRPELWVPRKAPYQTLLELWRHRQTLVEQVTAWSNRCKSPKTNSLVKAQAQTCVQVFRLQLEQTEAAIKQLIQSEPQMARNVELLTTIGAVGVITAAGTLAEAGPIECYPTPESLALAAGVAPIPDRSGTSVNRVNRKPYGNLNLKRVLALTGTNAKRCDPAISQFAERIAARGNKSASTINRACVRKILHIMWGVIHSQQPYDPAKAIQNFRPRRA
jgi:transposase